jgi:hypothetical protein
LQCDDELPLTDVQRFENEAKRLRMEAETLREEEARLRRDRQRIREEASERALRSTQISLEKVQQRAERLGIPEGPPANSNQAERLKRETQERVAKAEAETAAQKASGQEERLKREAEEKAKKEAEERLKREAEEKAKKEAEERLKCDAQEIVSNAQLSREEFPSLGMSALPCWHRCDVCDAWSTFRSCSSQEGCWRVGLSQNVGCCRVSRGRGFVTLRCRHVTLRCRRRKWRQEGPKEVAAVETPARFSGLDTIPSDGPRLPI